MVENTDVDCRKLLRGQILRNRVFLDFASGYVIGRAMWSGSNMSLTGIISITQGLLQDEESPWKQCLF